MPLHHTLQAYQGKRPVLGPGAFVAPNASVVGDVKLGKGSSVWYGAVLRGARLNPCRHVMKRYANAKSVPGGGVPDPMLDLAQGM